MDVQTSKLVFVCAVYLVGGLMLVAVFTTDYSSLVTGGHVMTRWVRFRSTDGAEGTDLRFEGAMDEEGGDSDDMKYEGAPDDDEADPDEDEDFAGDDDDMDADDDLKNRKFKSMTGHSYKNENTEKPIRIKSVLTTETPIVTTKMTKMKKLKTTVPVQIIEKVTTLKTTEPPVVKEKVTTIKKLQITKAPVLTVKPTEAKRLQTTRTVVTTEAPIASKNIDDLNVETMPYMMYGAKKHKRALIILTNDRAYEHTLFKIESSFEFLRVRYEFRLPTWHLEDLDKRKIFDIIVLLHTDAYAFMSDKNKEILKSYCKKHKVGIAVLHWNSGHAPRNQDLIPVRGYPITRISHLAINKDSAIWRLTKDGGKITKGFDRRWVAFDLKDKPKSRFSALTHAFEGDVPHTVGFIDNGLADGIPKVVLGNTLGFWLHHSVFLDSLHHLTHGLISLPLRRTVVIDIDDMFNGGKTKKIKLNDIMVRISLVTLCSR